jgi:pyoverdine/dityrosine biosynthesis protein Dit1
LVVTSAPAVAISSLLVVTFTPSVTSFNIHKHPQKGDKHGSLY